MYVYIHIYICFIFMYTHAYKYDMNYKVCEVVLPDSAIVVEPGPMQGASCGPQSAETGPSVGMWEVRSDYGL